MTLVHIVIALALFEYLFFGMAVGRARVRFGVRAPATSGNEQFERYYRVQMNTLEQLIVFVPAMLLFARYVSAAWAAALGLLFLLGRALYYVAYVRDPQKRGAGFGISYLPMLALLAGGLIGAALEAAGRG